MGCGGSRLGGPMGRAGEGGVLPLPAEIRPLLRRRLEEMKKWSHASVLKGNQTLSKKELLQNGSSEDGEETEKNDGRSESTAKVAPPPVHHVEEKKEVICEKISSKDAVNEVKEEEVVKKQEEENHDDNEAINVQKEEDDDEGRESNFDERMIGPASPSFRVYCIDVTSHDNDEEKEKDGEDARKSTKEDENITKKEKRERKGKRFGMGLPKKYLANVTAQCYAGGVGCMGNNTQSRLMQEKSNQ